MTHRLLAERCILVRASGRFDLAETLAYLRRLEREAGDPSQFGLIWDVRRRTEGYPDSPQVQVFVDAFLRWGRVAVVTQPASVRYGMARMTELLAERERGSVAAFGALRPALAWVRGRLASRADIG